MLDENRISGYFQEMDIDRVQGDCVESIQRQISVCEYTSELDRTGLECVDGQRKNKIGTVRYFPESDVKVAGLLFDSCGARGVCAGESGSKTKEFERMDSGCKEHLENHR